MIKKSLPLDLEVLRFARRPCSTSDEIARSIIFLGFHPIVVFDPRSVSCSQNH